MSTQRQFDLCMGPDTKETDCTQNTLHFYVKFIRRDRHITSIKNLRPKVACSLSRRLQWNSMHSQIWTSSYFSGEVEHCSTWRTVFRSCFSNQRSERSLKSESSHVLVRIWKTSREFRKLLSGWTSNRKLVSDRFLWEVFLKMVWNSSYNLPWWTYFSGVNLLFFSLENLLFRLMNFRISLERRKNSLSAIGFGFISYPNQQSQKSSYRNSSLSNEHFCITVSVLSTVRSTGSFQRRMRNSSNLQWAEKKSSQQFKSQFMNRKGSSILQFSKNDKGRKLVSAKISYEQKRNKEQFKISNDEHFEQKRKLVSANLQWASKMIFSA